MSFDRYNLYIYFNKFTICAKVMEWNDDQVKENLVNYFIGEFRCAFAHYYLVFRFDQKQALWQIDTSTRLQTNRKKPTTSHIVSFVRFIPVLECFYSNQFSKYVSFHFVFHFIVIFFYSLFFTFECDSIVFIFIFFRFVCST